MPAAVRLSLVEGDLDTMDTSLDGVRQDLAGLRKILVGILVSVTTASVLMVINIVLIGTR